MRDRHVGEQAGTRQRERMRHRNRLGEAGDAVQVGVDGDHAVEQSGEELADDALADHLARVEGLVLAHVGQVRRHQGEMARAATPGAARDQQQLEQLFVGTMQAAEQHHIGRQLGRQAQAQLVVGEAVALDLRHLQSCRTRETRGFLALIVEMQQQGVFGTH